MPPKRNGSASRSRSRGRKARSTSRPRTPSRARGGRAAASASAAAPAAAQPAVVTPVFNEPKGPAPESMWEADAKLMDAMSSGRSHVRSSGVRNFAASQKGRMWGYWIAIIVFQVVAIVWAKWAIDMYKQYRSTAH